MWAVLATSNSVSTRAATRVGGPIAGTPTRSCAAWPRSRTGWSTSNRTSAASCSSATAAAAPAPGSWRPMSRRPPASSPSRRTSTSRRGPHCTATRHCPDRSIRRVPRRCRLASGKSIWWDRRTTTFPRPSSGPSRRASPMLESSKFPTSITCAAGPTIGRTCCANWIGAGRSNDAGCGDVEGCDDAGLHPYCHRRLPARVTGLGMLNVFLRLGWCVTGMSNRSGAAGLHWWHVVVALVLLCRLVPGASAAEVRGEKLLVVDCLLPSQVRQLGTGFTYLAPRQAIKTTAADCEVRGGEYVAADRATGAAALRVWLPQAERGDKVAETYVGEIFEKGLGSTPDYQAAALWYRKAALQGYTRAMINLGFLYEKGLGGEKDPVAALNWYRRASGLGESIRLDAAAAPDRDAELNALRSELDSLRQQLQCAKDELARERERSRSEVEKLRAEQRAASEAGNKAEVQRLEASLHEKEAALGRRDGEVAELEQLAERSRQRVAALEAERSSLKSQLDESARALTAARDELARRQQGADQARADLQKLQHEAQEQQGAAAQSATTRLESMQAVLAQRERELTEQKAKIERLERASEVAREQAPAAPAVASASAPAVAGPSIQLIDPDLVVTRSPTIVPLRSALKYRDVVGRVVAPAGLLSLTVNDQSLDPEANGLFKTRVDIVQSSTRVHFVAVDRAGNLTRVDLLFQSEGQGAAGVASAAPEVPRVDFGRYYALVIGDQKYTQLPSLSTPEADAAAISDLLSKRYGFEVKTLLNATRYDILSELNRLRSTLTEHDNLLIYYAGHGELDRVNQRAYWLPVDAELNSDANWVSSVAITDILNVMSVRHALVIADSCYAGELTRSSLARLDSGMSDEARANWLQSIATSRSRTVMTSGGVKPVLDGGGGAHSVFAQVLIRVLSENNGVIEAQRVYQEIAARVLDAAKKARFDQRPEYAPMRFAGHESGDFLFVPRAP